MSSTASHTERPQLGTLSASAAAVALDGQRRLLRLLTSVPFSPGDQDGGDGHNCLVRAAEIELSLRRQATLETALLRRHPNTRRPVVAI